MGTRRLIYFIEISIFLFLAVILRQTRCQKRAGDKGTDLSDVNDLMITASPYTFLATVCQGVATRVSCQNPKSVMYIEDAFFGRANSYTCSSLFAKTSNTRCHSETAFRQIWKLCNGHNTCTLQALTSVLGDPCPGTDKYIQIHFRCASPGRDTIGYCEPSQWGHWLDEDHPFGNGDSELLSVHQIKHKVCQNPSGMQIRTTDDVNFFKQNEIIRHSLTYGVMCTNTDQDDGQCANYKVRYCCMHAEIPTSMSVCSFPSVDDDVLVSPMDRNSWTEGSAISFKCRNPTDTLLGPTSIYCGADGWLQDPPTCTPTSCRVLTKPANGVITNTPTHRLGGSYKFDCLPGFVISGPEQLVCQLNGQWNGRKPTCNIDKTVCGGIIMAADSGVIRSPNHPYLYPNNKDCSWQIAAAPNKFIEITIENVDIQPNPRCRNDYIEVHNGTRGNSLFVRKLCGSWKERTYTSNENILTMNFHSDKSHSGLGFSFRWKEIDGIDDSPKTCYGIGQSHFSTFDKKKLDFGGDCSYVLTKSKSTASLKKPFVIEVVKEKRQGSEGTWIASIVVRIQRFVISMEKGQQLVINDEIVSLPYHNKMNGIKILRLGTYVKLTTEDQLVVQFDGMYSFTVSLPTSLMNQVEGNWFEGCHSNKHPSTVTLTVLLSVTGLCGNYDGNLLSSDYFSSIHMHNFELGKCL